MARIVFRGSRQRRPARGPSPLSTADTELLARIPYFASLAAADLRRLARRCTPRRFHPHTVLLEEGVQALGSPVDDVVIAVTRRPLFFVDVHLHTGEILDIRDTAPAGAPCRRRRSERRACTRTR